MCVVTCVMNGNTSNTNQIRINYTVMHCITTFRSMMDHIYSITL